MRLGTGQRVERRKRTVEVGLRAIGQAGGGQGVGVERVLVRVHGCNKPLQVFEQRLALFAPGGVAQLLRLLANPRRQLSDCLAGLCRGMPEAACLASTRVQPGGEIGQRAGPGAGVGNSAQQLLHRLCHGRLCRRQLAGKPPARGAGIAPLGENGRGPLGKRAQLRKPAFQFPRIGTERQEEVDLEAADEWRGNAFKAQMP